MAKCESCYWAEQCLDNEVCEDFTPIEELDIDELIEDNRVKFRKEWFKQYDN